MKKSRSGFTVVELAVVIVVIGLLAALVVMSYRYIQKQARDDRRIADIANIQKAMELYYNDNGKYPSPTSGTGSVINSGWYSSGDSSWDVLAGKLTGSDAIDALPKDPLNTANGKPYTTDEFTYAVYITTTGNYCGVADGQMYLIVYKLERSDQTSSTEGVCHTKPVPTSYSAGASTYLNVKM